MSNKEISREQFLEKGGAAVLGSLLTAACTPEETKPTTPPPVRLEAPTLARHGMDIEGARPLPHVDVELVKKIIEIETGYNREDLLELTIRQKHLELCADFFARYSGELLTKEMLINSVNWVSDKKFTEKVGISAIGYTDPKTGTIFINENHPELGKSSQMRKVLPYWSSLSNARVTYWHEFFHKTTVGSGKMTELKVEKKSGGETLHLIGVQGFDLIFQKQNGQIIELVSDSTLTEAMVYILTSALEMKMSRTAIIYFNPDTQSSSIYESRVRLGITNLGRLFKIRPLWEEIFQKAHRESNFFSIAELIADSVKLPSSKRTFKLAYGYEVLTSITDNDPKKQQFFSDFLESIKTSPS